MRQIIAYNKQGSEYGARELPPSHYLKDEQKWIDEVLVRSPQLDGIVILIDWDSQQVTCIRENL